jgi:transposase
LLIGDSMCAKNTDTANGDTKGYCWYKATNGIKRHLLVDVLGNPYFIHCTKASVSDDEGLLAMIRANQPYFLAFPVGQVVTVLLDNGYHKEHLEQQLKQLEPLLLNCLKIEIAEKLKPERRPATQAENSVKQGFVVIKKRWIVERTNAWLNQCRALWKNCEGLLRTSEAKIRICAIRLILRRIA